MATDVVRGSASRQRVLGGLTALSLLVVAAIGASPSAQVNVRDTRLLHQPASDGTHVAFVYADDLREARVDGSTCVG